MKKALISFVIPCFGSEHTVSKVIDEIISVISEKKEYDYEIIAVNDLSPDKVWDVLLACANQNKKIKLLNLAKNTNRLGAEMAGLGKTKGEFVVVMDDDGQCPIDYLWDLMKPLNEGYDVSYADYPKREQTLFKDFGTYVNKRMTEIILDKPKSTQFTNFVVFKRFIVDEICKYKNPFPYETGLVLRTTSKIANVPMEQRERISGRTHFTIKKLVGLWMNGFTTFSIKPLRLSLYFGLLLVIISLISFICLFFSQAATKTGGIGLDVFVAINSLMFGIVMVFIGLIGEYIGRIYISINDSPQYVVKEEVNFN